MRRYAILLILAVLLTGCNCPPCPDATATPTEPPIVTVTPTATSVPDYLKCVDPRFRDMGVEVNVRPNARYKLIAAWGWKFGNKADAPGCAQQWMNFPSVGADQNVFGVIVGTAQPATFRLWWPDDETTRGAAGWIDVPIYAKFWDKGAGPYNFRFDGGDEILKVGLYQGNHWSFAGVWVDIMPAVTTIERMPSAMEKAAQ